VNFKKTLYFKTAGGEPKILKPGDYEVGLADDGIVLSPVGGKAEDSITVEPESLGTSAALTIPDMNDDPNFQALVLATVGGQSLIAVGSQDGTFPRGWKSWSKKKYKGAKNKVKKGARVTYGKAKKHGRKYAKKGYRAVKKHSKKYGKKYGKKAWKMGKRYVTKFCGSKSAQAAAAAAAASTGVGTVGSGAIAGGCLVVNQLK
jgi:hypothetical protein